MAVAALATMFGFASCSNGSDDNSALLAASTEKTKTVKIGDTEYVYTEKGGKTETSDKVKVSSDGTVTVTAADGSSITISADGKKITYKDKNGKEYTGDFGAESITLKSSDGSEITATSKTETKTTTPAVTTPAVTAAAANAFAGKTFVSEDGMCFVFGSDGNLISAVKMNKNDSWIFSISKQAYSVTDNKFSATIGKMNCSGTLSGTTLTAGDGTEGHTATCAQISGTNGFGGKSFISSDGTKLVVFKSDSKVLMLDSGSKKAHEQSYTVSGSKATGDGFEATLSGKSLTVKVTAPDGEHTDTGTLIE